MTHFKLDTLKTIVGFTKNDIKPDKRYLSSNESTSGPYVQRIPWLYNTACLITPIYTSIYNIREHKTSQYSLNCILNNSVPWNQMISNLPKGQASNPHFRSQEYVLSCTLLRRVKHTRSIIDVPCIPDETWSNRKTTASASLIVRIIAEKREWRMEKRCGRYSWLALVRILKEYIFPLKKIFFVLFFYLKKGRNKLASWAAFPLTLVIWDEGI